MLENAFALLAVGTNAAAVALVLRYYRNLPGRLPLRYSLSGRPKAEGHKAILLLAPAVVLAVIAPVMYAAHHPSPGRELPPHGPIFLALLFAEIGAMLLAQTWWTIQIALGKRYRQPSAIIGAGIAIILATVAGTIAI